MAGNCLEAAELTGSGRPTSPTFLTSKSGLLILTTHRLLWLSDSATASSGASAIPLASISHIFSAKKSLKSMFASPRIRFQLSVSPDGRVSSSGSGSGSRSVVVTVVVRGKGGDLDVFLTKFWDNWRGRAWETANADVTSGLNALMSKAREMVMLAEKREQKLLSGSTSQSGGGRDEELGSNKRARLVAECWYYIARHQRVCWCPVSPTIVPLSDFVRIPLERAGGMMNLIDIYCLFNRARGTELISPEDLLQACSLWEKFDVPVMLRKFDSGVMVIQNKSHSDEEIFARIKTLVTKPDALRTGVSASDAAITLGIAPGMAKEHLLTAESKGLLCRDISPDGFRFYINLFPEIDPNNVYLVKDYGVYDTWSRVASASG
ncbi:hypothetical protein M0R45_036088 [Rubus argutus]|uniref:Vacuolar protein-sorting-associated protein 36 n=1 Tax=Rubus argutus TaxID=59490 RepID=A0AAW1VZL4_RUBAR